MDFGFILVILFYYSHFIQQFKNVSAAHRHFQMIRDKKRVEKLAVEHSNYKRNWRHTSKNESH